MPFDSFDFPGHWNTLDGMLSDDVIELFRKTYDSDQHDRFLHERRGLVFRLKSEYQQRICEVFESWKFELIRAQSEPIEKESIWQQF